MPGSETAEVYFIAAMMMLILIISGAAVFFFFRQYRKEMRDNEKRSRSAADKARKENETDRAA